MGGTDQPLAVGVQLGTPLRGALLDHAQRESPNECCGLLIGTAAAILRAHPARNELASPVRFRVDPRDHLAAITLARAQGLDVIGAYHSHPTSAPVPSRSDLEDALPHFLYVIASLTSELGEQALRAWRLEGRNFVEVPLVTPAGEADGTPCASNPPYLR